MSTGKDKPGNSPAGGSPASEAETGNRPPERDPAPSPRPQSGLCCTVYDIQCICLPHCYCRCIGCSCPKPNFY